MIKETLRLIAVFLLLIIIIMDDFPFYNKMKNSTTQLFLGVFIVILIYYDAIFGFIMGLVLMLIYFEIYKKIIKKAEVSANDNTDYASVPNTYIPSKYIHNTNMIPIITGKCEPLKMDYISEAHLLAAQNNIFNPDCYTTEVKGIEKGFNGENVYGIQGLDSENVNYKGYSKSENLFSVLKKE